MPHFIWKMKYPFPILDGVENRFKEYCELSAEEREELEELENEYDNMIHDQIDRMEIYEELM